MANPKDLVDEGQEVEATDDLLESVIGKWNNSSHIRKTIIEPQAAKYQKVVKGIPLEDKSTHSKIRNRSKIYFRKVWSSMVRIVASLYQAFLKDKNKIKIFGRDTKEDFDRAKVLERMSTYRLEKFFRRDNGYVKLINGLQECVSPGFSSAKVHWVYQEDEDGNVVQDKPDMTLYPLEQVCLDWEAGTLDRMRYVYLENFLTKEELEELGYENIEKMAPIEIPESQLRSVRHQNQPRRSPTMQGDTGNYVSGAVGLNFPEPGSDPNDQQSDFLKRFRVVECWYKKKGKVFKGAVNPEGRVWAEKPHESEWGSVIPVAFGSMLLEPHKLVPESIVESAIGPQESLNMGMNMRKDNQALAMHGGFVFDRNANVNRADFKNIHPGWSAAADDINGILPIKFPDVTQTSYQETNADQLMIEENMGVNDVLQGQSTSGKTGEAQLNASLSQVKLDYFISNVAQTWFKQVMYLWVYNIQLFETDETVFRVANKQLREEGIPKERFDDIYDVEFDMDVEIEVGLTEVGRATRFNQMVSIVQNMNQSNQTTIGMLAQGIQPEQEVKLWDVSSVLAEYLPDLGVRNPNRFLFKAIPPPQEQQQKGGKGGQGTPAQNAQGDVPQNTNTNVEQSSTDEQAFLNAIRQNIKPNGG